ncbi:MAG: HAD-IA family hydrolase [Spirochaetales bacterium]|nr:HAD-IA family hydrolase [Spirochaetales bacterium]
MKTIILDMYGVIMKDTGDGFYSFVNRFFPNLPVEKIYPIWDKADIGKISSLEIFKEIGFCGDLAKIEKSYLDTVEINEGFYDFANAAKKSCKLALISNDSSEWSKYLREKYDLNKYFDVITISGDVKMRKPNEQIFKLTIDQLNSHPTECTYIDDRRFNLEAAQTIGMDAILFNSRNVEYDGKIVNDFKELAEMLKISS